jgi:hypothetical protein
MDVLFDTLNKIYDVTPAPLQRMATDAQPYADVLIWSAVFFVMIFRYVFIYQCMITTTNERLI